MFKDIEDVANHNNSLPNDFAVSIENLIKNREE